MRDMAKFLYTHNPFYLVSAGFVLYGLQLAFKTTNASSNNAIYLMASLCSYTLLLALTAWAVVRFGKVWDDARTIALLVVLMFLAISSSFDETCFKEPRFGGIVMALGWFFSLFTTEGLLRSLPVKLPWQYRLPYHLGLALFFAFSGLLMSGWMEQSGWTIEARVGSFASIAAAITLLLIPAAVCGPRLVRENRSPWPWPWYPWAIFLFLALGVVARSYMLTISYQSDVGWTSTFGPHYLTPFFLAILIVLAELSFSQVAPRLREAILVFPFFLLFSSVRLDGNESYTTLFDSFTNQFGSPLWLTLVSLIAFYFYVWLRGERRAEWPLILSIAIGALLKVDTATLADIRIHSVWLFAVIAFIQLIAVIKNRRSHRLIIVGACLAMIAYQENRFLWFNAMNLFLPLHIILIAVGLCGVFFKDALALFVRAWMPITFVTFVLATCLLGHLNRLSIPLFVSYPYAIAWTLGSLLIWYIHRDMVWKLVASACAAIFFCSATVHAIRSIEIRVSKEALMTMLIGAICFAVGVLVSAIKGGFKLPWLHMIPSHANATVPELSEDRQSPE